MRLGLRMLLGFFLITGIAAFFVLRVFVAEVRPSVREVMEDTLVDTANILAELATDDLAAMPPGGDLTASRFAARVRQYAERPVDARIWGLSKRSLDYRVYVTDAAGRVVFDTGFRQRASEVGSDYSQWRDVARTLRGEYGARATREVVMDEGTSVMYVAAPVARQGRVMGVLTVAKPMSTVEKFVDRAEREILVKGAWLLGLSLAVGVLVTGWIVWSVRRLTHFADHVQLGQRGGERLTAPHLPGELGHLALAMQAMRDRMEGHEHIEQMVRAMTHELKSPLAAIGGAAELLQDELPEADRRQFARQVQDQASRLHHLVERLLELSKLEQRRSLDHQGPVNLATCLAGAVARAEGRAAQRGVALRWLTQDAALTVRGEPELLQMAAGNLLDNAIDFAPAGSTVDLTLERAGGQAVLRVRDHGPGVPGYALPRLGERFFSTARPAGLDGVERKGSGLGLAIVRQIMALHGGSVEWSPAQPGFEAVLRWPAVPAT